MRSAGIEVVMTMHGRTHSDVRSPLVSEEPIGALQARHLVGAHRRIGYAYPDLPRLDVLAQPRLDGVREVCAEHGLPGPAPVAGPGLRLTATAADGPLRRTHLCRHVLWLRRAGHPLRRAYRRRVSPRRAAAGATGH